MEYPELPRVYFPSSFSSKHRRLVGENRFILRSLREWWLDTVILAKQARAWLAARPRGIILFLLATAAATFVLMLVDLTLLRWIQLGESGEAQQFLHKLARSLSYWGDFLGFNMIVFGGLGFVALRYRSLFFRRLTLAAVIGTLVCGGVANVSRLVTGRGRPAYPEMAGFHGPSFRSCQQSFPSAHTATSFGASVPVAVAMPPVGVPLLIVSAGVSWSRMENNRHHPSDVFVSICLSLLVGVPLGVVVRRMRSVELQRRRTSSTTSDQLDLAPLNPSTT
jgi:membrane-associated phospholipid phosphatase